MAIRSKRQYFLTNRVEIDAPALHVANVAKMTRLRRAMPDEDVAIRQLAALHTRQEILDVVHIEIAERLHVDGLRSDAALGTRRERVVAAVDIQLAVGAAELDACSGDAWHERRFEGRSQVLRILQ